MGNENQGKVSLMIRTSRTEIRNLASSDIAYSRGIQYYKNNKISNPTWSNTGREYHMTVTGGFDYSVTVSVNDDKSFDCSCNCPGNIQEKGACKHIVAALIFILKYEERSGKSSPKTKADQTIYKIIDYFSLLEDDLYPGETYNIEVNINIPKILKGKEGRAILNLRAGNARMYKVQALKKFLGDLDSNNNISLGKSFKYIHGESCFDANSMKVIDYLQGIYEIQEIIDDKNYSNLFSRSEMSITKNMIIKLLRLQGEVEFNLGLYGKLYKKITYLEQNPPIKYNLSLEDDSVVVDYNSDADLIPITDCGGLLFYDGIIYKPNKEFIRNLVPFYSHLGEDKEPLVFKDRNKMDFLEFVLPRISHTMELDVPQELMDRYVTFDLEKSIYFDRDGGSILAEVKFKYGEYEFNAFENPSSGRHIIIRQREKEDELINILLGIGFVPYKKSYILKGEEKIFDFVLEDINRLKDQAELFYSNTFRSINIRSIGKATAGIGFNYEINMLELDLSFDDIPKNELKDLFNSFKIKRKYYRLKDGSFIDLEDEAMESIANSLENLNISMDKLGEDKIEIEKQEAVYLDKVFSSKEFEYNKEKNFVELIDRILNPAVVEHRLPAGIQTELRPYQEVGYKWLKTLSQNDLGGILADDMGLGKTLQTIVYIASNEKVIKRRNEKNDNKTGVGKHPYLIICPSSLVYNWQDEIENFAPFLSSVVVSGTPEDREKLIRGFETVDILITSYPLMRRDVEIYKEIIFNTIIIDEAQYIKNESSLNSKSVKQLNGHNRFALTGTPIENNLSELWSIFDFIMPGYLGSHSKFVDIYEKPIMNKDTDALRDLNERITPFILRRMKKDVLMELPDKYETKMVTELTEGQSAVYQSYISNIRDELQTEFTENGIEKSRIKILAALTRLRQVCCHPGTFIDNYEGGSGKLDLLMDIIPEAIANDHRILVFSQFTSMLNIIEKELDKANISCFYLEGSTPTAERNDIVKKFNSGERKVFLISLKAGGTGLNLTGADMVIHYDPWWNPAVEDQATDRAYRIGQENKVHVLKLLAKDTIEEKIYKLQSRKKDLSDSIMDSKELFINKLSKEELEDLFT